MIQSQTILKVSDNSGAKCVKCIKILRNKTPYLGEIVLVSIQQLRSNLNQSSKVLKGDIFKAIILRVKNKIKEKDGSIFFFQENSVCLMDKQENLIGSRVFGPVSKILQKKLKLVVSL